MSHAATNKSKKSAYIGRLEFGKISPKRGFGGP
jgi:hypothetical protein